MAKWHYYNDKGEKITVTGGQLKGLAKAGQVTPDTIVETEAGKTAPARKVKGLTFSKTPAIMSEFVQVLDNFLSTDGHQADSAQMTQEKKYALVSQSIKSAQSNITTNLSDELAWYYYNKFGQKCGKFSYQELHKLAMLDMLDPDTLLEREDGHREVASQVPGFFNAIPLLPAVQTTTVVQQTPTKYDVIQHTDSQSNATWDEWYTKNNISATYDYGDSLVNADNTISIRYLFRHISSTIKNIVDNIVDVLPLLVFGVFLALYELVTGLLGLLVVVIVVACLYCAVYYPVNYVVENHKALQEIRGLMKAQAERERQKEIDERANALVREYVREADRLAEVLSRTNYSADWAHQELQKIKDDWERRARDGDLAYAKALVLIRMPIR